MVRFSAFYSRFKCLNLYVNFCVSRKGKKDGKQDSKADKETDVEKSKATAALWELRSKVTDQSLGQYQEACGRLARVNEELTTQLYRAEKETIDVSAFQLKRDATREQQVQKAAKGV